MNSTFLPHAGAAALLALALAALPARAADPIPAPRAMTTNGFELPPLPYAQDALEPHVSAKTLGFHYGKHHRGYVDALNGLAKGTDYEGRPLEEVIRQSQAKGDKPVFNNAAQVWNHTFFWNSMKRGGGGKPEGAMLKRIESSFGSFDHFRKEFTGAALAQFGSGYVWLVQEGDAVTIEKTPNAETPLTAGRTPLLACDIWEHAYYLDYQNQRKAFVETFLDKLVNWEFAQSQVK